MVGKKRPEPPVDEDEAFPRGGRDDLTPLEKRQLSQQAEADFKQEQAGDTVGKKQKKRAKHSNDQDDVEGAFFAKSAVSGKVQHVEQLKYKSLVVGMKLWGCVLEVAPEGLVVSLPHGLRGSVAPQESSDLMSQMLDPSSKRGAALRAALPGKAPPPLTQLFSVGQFVRCTVKELREGGKEDEEAAAADAGTGGSRKAAKASKQILLSLKLKPLLGSSSSSSAAAGSSMGPEALLKGQVVPAVVKSVEDRGYSLSFGIKGVTGFLPLKDYTSYYGTEAPLLPGTLLDVVVTQPAAAAAGPAGAVVQVSVAHDAVAGGQLQTWEGLNMGCLLPGSLVGCKVRQVVSDGLLVSFGGFFHGSLDFMHLGDPVPEADWQSRYPVGTKLTARLLYVDAANKKIGLSCLPHLLNCRLPSVVPTMGHIFDRCTVARVDPGLGLLLRLPTEPEQGAGFCHVSNLSDGQLAKAEVAKRFSVGSEVRGRVIGFRLMDGLVAMTLKERVLAQQVYSVKDLYPGQMLDVTVLDLVPAGLMVSITQNLKALVPKIHMTDTGASLSEGSKLPSKLKPGKTLQARVLAVDAVHKRVQLTLKKGLLGSKLPVLCDLRQAEPGMKLHGVVTGVQGFGVYVGFYGGVAGLMPKSQLDLLPGQEPGDVYSMGQLLRCQVASVDMRKGKLVLRPAVKRSGEADQQGAGGDTAAAAAAAEPWGGLAVGSLVAGGGVVGQVLQRTPEEGGGLIELMVEGPTGQQVLAHLPAAHLSDHPGGVEALIGALKPGQTLPGPLLVLQQRRLNPSHAAAKDRWQSGDDAADEQQQGSAAAGKDGVPMVLVSRKGLLVAAADKLPGSAADVTPGAVLPGYVASISRDAVFVRFLGRCTGRAGLPQLADTFVTDPARHFTPGQTVMAAVVALEEGGAGGGKFAVSLKPSVAGSHEGKFLAGLMSDLELAYQLQQAAEAAAAAEAGEDEDEPAAVDWSLFPPGKAVGATLHELKGYGAVMDLEDNPDVVGLVVPEHSGKQELTGSGRVTACILDASKPAGIIELSLLPELTNMAAPAAAAAAPSSSKKASKKAAAADEQQQQQLVVGAEVQAMVQLIKDHYVVASVVQQQQQQQGKAGKKAAAAAAADSKQQQQHLQHIAIGFLARGDLNSQGSAGKEARRFSRAQVVAARVAATPSTDNGGRLLLELTQPLLPAAAKGAKGSTAAAAGAKAAAAAGGLVSATVVAVHDLELELVCGKAGSTAHIHVSELQERLTEPPKGNPLSAYKVQQQVTAAWLGHVKGLGHKRGKDQQLSLRPSALAAAKQGGEKAKVAPVLAPSDLRPNLKVVAWVCGMTPDALWLSLAPEVKGRVHLLESGDNPEQLAVGFEERFSMGQALTAVVLGIDPKHHTLDLSLRADRVRKGIADPAAAAAAAAEKAAVAAAADSLPAGGALLPGRVASVTGSGVVVQLGPKLQGLVALTDIHDGWASNALTGLSAGVYVRARVLAAAGGASQAPGRSQPLVDSKGRVVLSLRPSDGGLVCGAEGSNKQGSAAAAAAAAAAGDGLLKDGLLQLQQVKVGTKVQGYVRSVSTKGLFVVLDRCHDARIKLSQLSDGYVEDPAAAFPVGSRVEGRVLSIEHTKTPQQQGSAAAAAAAGFTGVRVEDDGVRVELSLRSGEGSGGVRTLADIKEGELTTGKVRRIERYGVFVELARSRVSGLVHISQIGKGFVKDLASHYSPGQVVSVRVLSVDLEGKGKVNLSMKPELLVGEEEEGDAAAGFKKAGGRQGLAAAAAADFDDEMVDAMEVDEHQGGSSSSSSSGSEEGDEDEDEAGSSSQDEEQEDEEEGGSSDVDLDDMDMSEEEEGESGSEAESGSDDDDDVMPPHGLHNLLQPGLAGTSAAAAAGSDWGELQLQDGAEGAAAGAAANGAAELTRAQKKRLKVQHEAEIRAAERARAAGTDGDTESVAGYEAQLLAEPNSSYLWIKLMAFQLKLGEIDAARRVAERALSTIAMTAEREKFNVWVALMNLENAYGGAAAEEAVMGVFKRAVQYVEPKALYLALLGILERSGRLQLAGEVWRTATKKFNTSCKVWLGAFESALQAANRAAAAAAGDGDDDQPSSSPAAAAAAGSDGAAARQLLERALKSLPKHKHIKALTRAALAEFRLGCAERGRSIFEGMLANYPKRTDIWNVYIDQEVKAGDAARTRSLLARATSLSLAPKKMRVLFRRWLEYEQAHGSAADVAAVKQRAVEYMENQALGASS